MIGRPGTDDPNHIWLTQPETLREFAISRTTLWRWRTKHLIREAHVKRYPTMYNLADLQEADAVEAANNPVIR